MYYYFIIVLIINFSLIGMDNALIHEHDNDHALITVHNDNVNIFVSTEKEADTEPLENDNIPTMPPTPKLSRKRLALLSGCLTVGCGSIISLIVLYGEYIQK